MAGDRSFPRCASALQKKRLPDMEPAPGFALYLRGLED
jgi:hypothetical protein